MKKILFILFISLCGYTASAQWSEERNYYFSEAERAARGGDFDSYKTAVAYYKSCLKLNYMDTMAHYSIAGVYAQMANNKRDTNYYNLAISEYAISDSIMPVSAKKYFYNNRAATLYAFAELIFIAEPKRAMGLYVGAKKDYEVYNTIYPNSRDREIEQVVRKINYLKYDVGIR